MDPVNGMKRTFSHVRRDSDPPTIKMDRVLFNEFHPAAMPRPAVSLLCSLVLLAAGAASAMPGMKGMPPGHPKVMRGDITTFEVIAGDIARHRGEPGFAYDAYMDAARRERSAELAGQAWEAAVQAQDSGRMVEAAKLWYELDPLSAGALNTLLVDAVEQGRPKDAEKLLTEAAGRFDARKDEKGKADPGAWFATTARIFRGLPPNRVRDAVTILDPWAAKYPKRADVGIAMAQLRRTAGDRVQACRAAEKAIALDPKNSSLLVEAADICWQGDRTAAFRMLNEHLKRRPKDADVRIVLARALERSGERAKALEAAERAVKDAGENLRIYQNAGQIAAELNDVERTTRWLTEYVKRVREGNPAVDLSRAELWLQLGNAALTKRDFTAAARYYRELQAGPFAVQARLREAVALSDGGKTEEALQTLRTARTNLKLDAPVLFSAEASLLMEKGRAPEALEVMNAALEAHPTDPEILYEAAMLAQETGDSALSEKRLQTLLSMNPEHVQANNALGYLWVEQNRNLTEARALLEKAYRADPLNPYILDSMGWLCYREGRLRAAREFVSASLKKLYDAEVAAHLVIILQKSGDQKAAEATFAELLEHDPEHPTVARLRELLGKKP